MFFIRLCPMLENQEGDQLLANWYLTCDLSLEMTIKQLTLFNHNRAVLFCYMVKTQFSLSGVWIKMFSQG